MKIITNGKSKNFYQCLDYELWLQPKVEDVSINIYTAPLLRIHTIGGQRSVRIAFLFCQRSKWRTRSPWLAHKVHLFVLNVELAILTCNSSNAWNSLQSSSMVSGKRLPNYLLWEAHLSTVKTSKCCLTSLLYFGGTIDELLRVQKFVGGVTWNASCSDV